MRRRLAFHPVVQVRASCRVCFAVSMPGVTDRRVFDSRRLGYARDKATGGRDRGTFPSKDVFGGSLGLVGFRGGDYYISW